MNASMLRAAGASAALTLLIACASAPPAPIERENLQQVQATVVDVEKSKRLVSLRGPDGRVTTLELGPEVRNFDQIHVGDAVVATYYEAIGFALKDPKEADEPGAAGIVAGRAAPGERPEAAIGKFVETTVTIQSVDSEGNSVTFKGEDGLVRTVPVKREDGRAFAKKLKPGDRVVISYEEALAISVQPGK